MRYLLYILPLIFLATGCGSRSKESSGTFTVSAELDNAQQVPILVEELTTQDKKPVDTLMTDDQGRFSFSHEIKQAGFYILRVDAYNFLTLVVEPGEEINITGDAANLSHTFQVEGSPGSEKLATLNRSLARGYQQVDSLTIVYQQNMSHPDLEEFRQQLDVAYTHIFKEQQQYVKDFISENPHSLVSIIALYKYFGDRLLLNEQDHFEYFEQLSQSLREAYPKNHHVMDLKRRVGEYRRNEKQRQVAEASLAPGNQAPEIVLPDPEGNMIALSSLRGKVVLIDFWAAWCPPCRKVNSRLIDIYAEYQDQGFEIYGISLDRTREQWIQGIAEDHVTWTQVSDLRFWSSPVVGLYNVEGIPYSVLVDQQGNIIAKGVGVDELEDILDDLLR
ncbi:MAG: TlpA disulfide reductase family protein [Bacteroidales bacterium]